MLLSASNQPTAYRPHTRRQGDQSAPRAPAGLLIDQQRAFTPENNCTGEISAYSYVDNDDDLDADVVDEDKLSAQLHEAEEDPVKMEEVLRQKIEETNQKISDYFKKQHRYVQQQQQIRPQPQNRKSGSIVHMQHREQPHRQPKEFHPPQRLDFYAANINHESYPDKIDEVKNQQEPRTIQRTHQTKSYFDIDDESQEVVAPRNLKSQSRPRRNFDDEDELNDDQCKHAMKNATESLNQTLMRFQSMIKQVEQRFAERERLTNTSQQVQPPSYHQRIDYRQSAQIGSQDPERSQVISPQRLQRPQNEYDLIKRQIDQKQNELLNSQYSLNPQQQVAKRQIGSQFDQSEPASSSISKIQHASNMFYHPKTTTAPHQGSNSTNQRQDCFITSTERDPAFEFSVPSSRKNLLDELNKAASVRENFYQPHHNLASEEHLQQARIYEYQQSPSRQSHIQRTNTFEVARERLLQQAISASPTKMFEQPQSICLSPNRRQPKNYLEVSQPAGDTSSLSQVKPEESFSRMSLEITSSRQPSFHHHHQHQHQQTHQQNSGNIDSYYNNKHEELLNQISDTIHRQDVVSSQVGKSSTAVDLHERLNTQNKSKSPLERQTSIGTSSYNNIRGDSRTANKKSSSTIYKHQQSSLYRRTDCKPKSTYDPDYFGMSDIQIGVGPQPCDGTKGREPSHSGYSLLAQAQQRLRRQGSGGRANKEHSPLQAKNRFSNTNLTSNKARNHQNQTMVHDYIPKENRVTEQASPIKRHQASPIKSSSASQSKRTYSAYKSPQKRQQAHPSTQTTSTANYTHQHQNSHVHSTHNKQIPSYMQMTASYSASRSIGLNGKTGNAGQNNPNTSFYDQSNNRRYQGYNNYSAGYRNSYY